MRTRILLILAVLIVSLPASWRATAAGEQVANKTAVSQTSVTNHSIGPGRHTDKKLRAENPCKLRMRDLMTGTMGDHFLSFTVANNVN
jgi:hypothetical protein